MNSRLENVKYSVDDDMTASRLQSKKRAVIIIIIISTVSRQPCSFDDMTSTMDATYCNNNINGRWTHTTVEHSYCKVKRCKIIVRRVIVIVDDDCSNKNLEYNKKWRSWYKVRLTKFESKRMLLIQYDSGFHVSLADETKKVFRQMIDLTKLQLVRARLWLVNFLF